ncbi:outer kinetochore KNL1 complex subunit ZWINT [Pelodytes ibericus]
MVAQEPGDTGLLDTLESASPLGSQNHREDGEVPAKVLVDYSMERRRKQRMLCGQLQVLRFLLEFLEQADTANWEETSPEILSQEAEEVKRHWKAMKSEYQDKVKEIEDLIPRLLQKQQLLHQKRNLLEDSLQHYRGQRVQEWQSLQDLVLKQGHLVQQCQIQIHRLEDEVERLEETAESWIQTVRRDSAFSTLLRTLQGVTLVSFGIQELVLDLNVDEQTSPLRLTLRWTAEGEVCVEADGAVPVLPQELLTGSKSQTANIILELQSWYRSQTRLLKELGVLQNRFTIDWLPVQRIVLFLKGSTTYRLLIGPEYPDRGGVRLLSLPDTVKLQKETPSLSDWLEYLQNYQPPNQ